MIRLLQKDTRVVKALFAIIIGAACLSMVVYLVPGLYDGVVGDGSDVYASVHTPGVMGRLFGDSDQIKTTDVARMTERLMQQSQYPAFYRPFVEQQAQQLAVAMAVEVQEAHRLRLDMTDNDVREFLKNGQIGTYLFPNGQFIGQDKYREFVQNVMQLPSTEEFERQVKQDLERERLREYVTAGVTISDNSVREEYRKQGTKVKIDYVTLSGEDVTKDIAVTDSEVKNFWDKNQARYANAAPETRKFAYVVMTPDNLPGGRPQVTDADIQGYYNGHKDQYKVEDQVKVRHILIMVPQGADAKADAAAKAKAQDILNKVKAGGDFAELAKQFSEDTGSKASGGDLGWVKKNGQMVPEFETAALGLAKGQTSGLVKTQFGYHILHADDRQSAHVKSMDEVKDEIRPLVLQQKLGNAQQQMMQAVAQEAAKNGLASAAAAHHLTVQTTDFVPAAAPVNGVPDSSAVLAAAFQAKKGEVKSTTTGEATVVLQLQDIKPAHAPTFEEWKQTVANDYKNEQIPAMMQQRLTRLSELAKQKGSLKAAASELKMDVKSSDLLGREGNAAGLGLMSGPGAVAFTLAQGGVSAPINTGRSGAVLQVMEKQEPSAEDIAQNMTKTRDSLLQKKRDEVFGVYMGTVLDRYKAKGGIRYSRKQKTPAPAGM